MAERVKLACSYLDEYENFQMGLSSSKLNFHFQIKGEQTVLMEGRREYPSDRYSQLFGIQFSGEFYVNKFKQLFEELWEQALTDKTRVKAWLKEHASLD